MSSAVTGFICLTASAQRQINALLEEEATPMYFRVYVTGGGCSGFQYGFAFDKEPKDGDTEVQSTEETEQQAVNVLIDPISYSYLQGATVDYEESLLGARFVVNNPNAKTTCGCGSSFSV